MTRVSPASGVELRMIGTACMALLKGEQGRSDAGCCPLFIYVRAAGVLCFVVRRTTAAGVW
jgi:hypothetical protein